MDRQVNNARAELFVWRSESDYSRDGGSYSLPALPQRYHGLLPLEELISKSNSLESMETVSLSHQLVHCPFCTRVMTIGKFAQSSDGKIAQCSVCGFYAKCFNEVFIDHSGPNGVSWVDNTFLVAELRRLSINDADLGIDELAAHIRRRFVDIYQLSPLRFELLVEDIFKKLGYKTRRTQHTRDGGYDIVLLERKSEEQILVECKRYAAHRRVGVGIVRQLLGVQLISGIRRAKIVSTSRFTEVASAATSLPSVVDSGIELELIDADRLLRELELYNVSLPPLDAVDF